MISANVYVRLWQSRPGNDFDLDSFNKGDYVGAVQERHHSENITSVLCVPPPTHNPEFDTPHWIIF
jgi:hypothetical protein